MRTYLLLRLYRLTLLLGTSGAIVTAPASENIQARGAAFAVMDFSAGGHWVRLRARANELAAVLGYQVFPEPSRWNLFTAAGAGNYLYLFVVLLWFGTLFLHPPSDF